MPTLKDLKCSIELSESEQSLEEFGTKYGDGCVETFVPVPSKPQAFSVHVTSDKFIAPGISMYVFVDGVYQCNRNRQNLKFKKGSDSHSVVDFRVRQKEEKQKDGSMIAREWKFERLDTTSAVGAPDVCSPNILDNIGCIEVLILRCVGPRNAKTVSAMALDGASDMPFQPFGFDGQPGTPESRSVYDDRIPFFSGQNSDQGPPPPTPYRSPYAETVHSHDTTKGHHHDPHSGAGWSSFAYARHSRPQSRYSEPISPSARRRPPSIPSEAFQYGSGPIPPGPIMGSERNFYRTRPSAVVTNAPDVDSAWLNEMLTKAAKRGAQEARRAELIPETHKQKDANVENVGQPPGAWPQSPFEPMSYPIGFPQYTPQYDTGEDSGAPWGGPKRGWSGEQPRDKSKSVNWDDEPTATRDDRGGWTGQEETASETWDTGETWVMKRPEMRRKSHWNTSEVSTFRSRFQKRARSPATTHTRQSRHSDGGHQSRKSRLMSPPTTSKWSERGRSPSEDREGWICVDASSNSLASGGSTGDTKQLPRPRSHGRKLKHRSRSEKGSSRAHSAHGDDRKSSRHIRGGGGSEITSKRRHAQDSWDSGNDRKSNWDSLAGTGWYDTDTDAKGKGKDDWAVPVNDGQIKDSWCTEKRIDNGWIKNQSGWEARDDNKNHDTEAKVPGGWGPEFDNGNTPKNAFPPPWETQNHSWNGTNTPSKAKEVQWDSDTPNRNDNAPIQPHASWDTNPWQNVPPPPPATSPQPAKPTSTSKRHTSKSLSKYRQIRPVSDTGPKPHWQFPSPPSSTPKLPSVSESLPPEPPLKISRTQASEAGLSHQVRLGSGSQYGHAISRPEYLDTLEKPYAVFRFKYRSRKVLKDMFGDAVPDRGHLTERTDKEAKEVKREKEKLGKLGREELIERLVGLKMKKGDERSESKDSGHKSKRQSRSKTVVSKDTESVARHLTESWVRQHSREASEEAGKEKGWNDGRWADPNKWT